MPSENSSHCDAYGTRSIHKQRICSLWHAMVAVLCAILGLPTLLVKALAPVYDSSRILVPTPSISLIATKTDPKSGITPVFKDTPQQCLNKQILGSGPVPAHGTGSMWVRDLGLSYNGILLDEPIFHRNLPAVEMKIAKAKESKLAGENANFVLAKLSVVYRERVGAETDAESSETATESSETATESSETTTESSKETTSSAGIPQVVRALSSSDAGLGYETKSPLAGTRPPLPRSLSSSDAGLNYETKSSSAGTRPPLSRSVSSSDAGLDYETQSSSAGMQTVSTRSVSSSDAGVDYETKSPSAAGTRPQSARSAPSSDAGLGQKRSQTQGTKTQQQLTKKVKASAALSSSKLTIAEDAEATNSADPLPPRFVRQELSAERMGFCFKSAEGSADLERLDTEPETEPVIACHGWKHYFGDWRRFEEFLKHGVGPKYKPMMVKEKKKQCAAGDGECKKVEALNAAAYAHSEQALLGSYYLDAQRCFDKLRSSKCNLYMAAKAGGWWEHICDIELFVLDVISIPNSVCHNCDASFISANFVDMYNAALHKHEACKSRRKTNLKARLIVRTTSYELFKSYTQISCAGLNYNTRITDFIEARDSITLHKLPNDISTSPNELRRDINRRCANLPQVRKCAGNLFEETRQQTMRTRASAAAGSDE